MAPADAIYWHLSACLRQRIWLSTTAISAHLAWRISPHHTSATISCRSSLTRNMIAVDESSDRYSFLNILSNDCNQDSSQAQRLARLFSAGPPHTHTSGIKPGACVTSCTIAPQTISMRLEVGAGDRRTHNLFFATSCHVNALGTTGRTTA